MKSKNAGQKALAAAIRFFRGQTKRGASWLRAKRANRLRVLRGTRHVDAFGVPTKVTTDAWGVQK